MWTAAMGLNRWGGGGENVCRVLWGSLWQGMVSEKWKELVGSHKERPLGLGISGGLGYGFVSCQWRGKCAGSLVTNARFTHVWDLHSQS